MGQIMTRSNLRIYMKWRDKPWEVDDILYERLPMLAVRNYLNDDAKDQWPLCWTQGRPLRLGLSVCIEALKGWQAFRGRLGVAGATRRKLYERAPGVVMRFQRWLRDEEIYSVRAAIRQGQADQLIRKMARAVAKISACKRTNTPSPMLGSKVLHFFFPEFFPVWDTAWIRRTIRGMSKKNKKNRIQLNDKWQTDFGKERNGAAARQYAAYLELMLSDLEATSAAKVKDLRRIVVSFSAKRNNHGSLRDVVDENLWDMSPILFELCLMGYGRAGHVLP
jgi:hypothetical protein